MKKSAIDRAITYFENLTPQTVEQYEAAHDAMACLREAKKDKARLDWMIKGDHGFTYIGGGFVFSVNNRQAIDRAMKDIK